MVVSFEIINYICDVNTYRYFTNLYNLKCTHRLFDWIFKMVDGYYVVSLLRFANVIELVSYFFNI
jgi:hypothetical protein